MREDIARKYAKDLWVVNFRYFLDMNGLNVGAWEAGRPSWEDSPEYAINYTILREHLLNKYNEDMAQNVFNTSVVTYDTQTRERFEITTMDQGFVMPE